VEPATLWNGNQNHCFCSEQTIHGIGYSTSISALACSLGSRWYNRRVSDEKKSIFERFSQFVVPLVVAVAAMFFQHQRTVALALIGFGCLSLVVSTFPWLAKRYRKHRLKQRETEVVKVALGNISRHVRQFSQFTDLNTTDAVNGIVFGSLCGNNMAHYGGLRIVEPRIFNDLREQLSSRVALRTAERNPSYQALRMTVEEFSYLVSAFCRYVLNPIYEQVPTKLAGELRGRYSLQIQGELIQFRERFVSFLSSYTEFLRELEERLPRPLGLGYYIQGPKPLQILHGGKMIAEL